MLNLLHLHQATRQSTKLQSMGWEKPLQRLIDSAKRSWTVSTLLPMPSRCGKAYSASQTTRPPRTLISAPQKACRMTSTVSMPASRPPASIQRGGTHTLGPPNPLLPPPTVSSTVEHKAPRKINPRKAAGPDNIPVRALRACATELADVLASIFNLSLSQSTVPTCFKTTTIVPLPKKSTPACLNDYRPVALTQTITKCFERVVLAHIQSCMPNTLDPLQYAYRTNRSTSDAIAAALHFSLSHLEDMDTYIRMIFIDYSSAFNTVIPCKLIHNMFALGLLHPTLGSKTSWLADRSLSGLQIGPQTPS